MLDPALRGIADATSEENAEQSLESLISDRLSPLVRAIVGRKLRSYGGTDVIPVEDLEDVSADAILVLLRRLRTLRDGSEREAIENVEHYAATVTYNVCAHYLRRLYPERSRLKNRLRYVLGSSTRFAVWDVSGEGACCGLSAWRGRDPDPAATETLARWEREPDVRPARWTAPALVDRADPGPLVADVFNAAGGPIVLDDLVALVAAVWQVGRSSNVEQARSPGAVRDAQPEAAIDSRRLVERTWDEVRQLPIRQRVALLLNLRDSRGAGMLWIFAMTGVASIRSIADVLEISAEELAGLWNRLPVDDTAIAEQLGCTRQQVINLRMSARKRLANRLRAFNPADQATRGRGANLLAVSVSTVKDR